MRVQMRSLPRAFYAAFGPEMVDVFAETLQDAARQGAGAVLRVLLREGLDLPLVLALAHVRERRKPMLHWEFETERDVRMVRWMARGLALLFAAFILSIFLFNEDVRQDLNPPTLILGLLALSLLLSWRWERWGGLLTLAGVPLFVASVLVTWLGAGAGWLLAMAGIAALTSLPPLIVGWMFLSLAQVQDYTRDVGARLPRPYWRWPGCKNKETRPCVRTFTGILAPLTGASGSTARTRGRCRARRRRRRARPSPGSRRRTP
jgi:hypothetical protein